MSNPRRSYRFDEWIVEPNLNRMSLNDKEIQLEPRAMDVLAVLLDQSGEVVSTDELLDAVWEGRYNDPGMVAKRISKIRHALGDDAKDPRYIATVSKRGYRAIANVEFLDDCNPVEESGISDQRVDLSMPAVDTTISSTPISNSFSLKKAGLLSAAGAVLIFLSWSIWAYLFPEPHTGSENTHSIAVLPLDNFSGNPAQDYIADGMTEEIITELGKLKQLSVTSRTSVMQYKKNRPSIKKIARELGVQSIIEGSIAREAGLFRVTIQLIDAESDTHLWSHSFDREVSSVLELRSDIASKVASILDIDLSKDELANLTYDRTVDRSAYDAYLRGIAQIGAVEQFRDWYPKATANLQTAVSLDPEFAEAWAKLALIEVIKAVFLDRNNFEIVKVHTDKALSIDSRVATAHTARGYISLLYDWDFEAAGQSFRQAVKLSPGDRITLNGYLVYLRLMDRDAEADQISQQLVKSSPFEIRRRNDRIDYLYGARLYEMVLQESDDNRRINPDFYTMEEAAAYHRLDLFHQSYVTRMKVYNRCGSSCDEVRSAVEAGWETAGHEGVLQALAKSSFQELSPRGKYWILAQIGESDRAFEEITDLAKKKVPWLIGIRNHPDFDVLRLDPKFEESVNELGLPPLSENPARIADVARLMAFRGRGEEAVENLNRAIKIDSENPRLPRWTQSMAWAYFSLGQYVQAIEWAEKIVDFDVDAHATAFAQLLIASSYANTGQIQLARDALEIALRSWPIELEAKRDLEPLFIGGSKDLKQQYLTGLRAAGLDIDA